MTGMWELPTSLCVGGADWNIRTDFRAVLDILKYFNDPGYEPDEQWAICLSILYEDYDVENPPPQDIVEEMCRKATEFIDMGMSAKDDGRQHKPRMMDWEQDAAVIIPSVNRVLGKEVRSLGYLHWWTFLGAYMEIGESLFSQILNIRMKKAKKQKLEKWEQEFYRENRALIDLHSKRHERSREEREALDELFGRKKKR